MFVSLFILALGACGGGGGGESSPATPQLPAPPPSPDPPSGEIDISLAEGARFLRQASFGPAEGDVVSLQTTGYEGWVDNQINAPASSQLQHLSALPPPENGAEGRRNRLEAFFKYALENDDQLRQRMAFALSEIMVVSDQGALANRAGGLASYYDMLSEHAFGNFRDLIGAVTLHPAMGVYLSMLGNEKPDAARNIRPDSFPLFGCFPYCARKIAAGHIVEMPLKSGSVCSMSSLVCRIMSSASEAMGRKINLCTPAR